MKKEEKEIVRIEQDWAWMYAYLYLENLKHLREIWQDDKFAAKFDELMDVVYTHTDTPPYDGDIVKVCLITERYANK